MGSLTDTIQLVGTSFVIKQGRYDLTSEAMTLRGQSVLYTASDYTFYFTLVDSAGLPVVITSDVMIFSIKKSVSDPDLVAIADITATIVSGTAGTFTVALTHHTVPGPERILAKYSIQRTHTTTGTPPVTENSVLIYGDIEFVPSLIT